LNTAKNDIVVILANELIDYLNTAKNDIVVILANGLTDYQHITIFDIRVNIPNVEKYVSHHLSTHYK